MKFSLLSSASLLAIGSGLAMLSPQQAHATPSLTSCGTFCETETVGLGATTTDFHLLPVTLNQFAPLTPLPTGVNAVLTSVVINETGSYTTNGSLHNTALGSEAFTFKFGESLTMTKGAGAPSIIASKILSTGLLSSPYTLGSGASTTFSQGGAITPSASQLLTSGLSAFDGNGTFNLLFSSDTTEAFSGGGGNVTPSLTTTASPSVTITYNYTTTVPAPEPASFALVGAAIAGLGVVRRRRKA